MSIIIDEIIFETESENQTSQETKAQQNIVYQIFKLLKIHQKSLLCRNDQKLYQIKSLVALPECSFIVQLEMHKISKITRLQAMLVEQFQYQKVWSRQKQILLAKRLMKHHKELSIEFNIYINKGRILMTMNNFLQITKQSRPLRVAEAYNQIIMKSLRNFEVFVQKYLRKTRLSQDQKEKENFFYKQIQIARILHSTQGITNISANKSQYKSANQMFEKQKEQLNLIQKNIEQQNLYERSLNQLFFNIPDESTASWLRTNFIPFYQFTYKKFKTLLSIVKQSGEKKIQDFIFNMAKIQVKDLFNGGKPIGQGGSSMIFVARAFIVFISSTDLVSYPQNTQKVERAIAIKKLKNAEQRKYKDKLEHQKKIVAKMRSSVCQFIPKYYGTETDNNLSSSLVMEMLQGDQLDFYISSHIETISLWTKLTLLLNVIHGMKHLVNYQIVHLDLKPTNIIVCNNLITKIIDFGQAYHKQLCASDYVPGFTFPYVAPEVYIKVLKNSFKKPNNNLQFTQKQDIFAFGIILFEVIFEGKAFPLGNNKSKQVYAKRQNLIRFYISPEKAQYYGEELIMSTLLYLIVRCIDPDPSKRPCFEWIGIVLKLILNSQNNIH